MSASNGRVAAPGALGMFSIGSRIGKVMPQKDILDPYVRITYKDATEATQQCLNGGLDCEFPEEHLTFAHQGPLAASDLVDGNLMLVEVLDKDNFDSDDLVGSGHLELTEDEIKELNSRKCTHVVELQDKDNYFAGMVFIDIKHDPAKGQIDIVVTRCKNLRDVREGSARDATNQGANQLFYMAAFALLIYFTVGTLFYSLVPGALYWDSEELNRTSADYPMGQSEWEYETIPAPMVDALYFTVVTLTTVGYGDMGPKTQGTRLFTCFFALIGIGFIGVCMGIVMGRIMDAQEALAKKIAEEVAEAADDMIDAIDGDDDDEDDKPMQLTKETKRALVKSFSLCVVILIGTVFYTIESKGSSFADCIYFATITATTVGYGDESPSSWGGRLAACFYLFAAVCMTADALSALAELPLAVRRRKHKEAVLAQFGAELTMHELDMICRNFGGSDGRCTRLEFVIAMLIKTNTIGQDDIDMAAKQFDLLDKDKSGSLGIQDLLLQDSMDGEDDDEKAQEHMKKKNLKLIQQEELAIQNHIAQLTDELEVLRSKKKMFTDEQPPPSKSA